MTTPRLLVPAEVLDSWLAARGWTWRQLERGEIELGGKRLTADELQVYLVASDPVLWVERNLVNRPEDGGGLWRLFAYQKPSMRYRGDVVHEDGAEVGKTREIVGLLLWGSLLRAGGSLVASSQDSDLDEIWDELEWQRSKNEWLDHQIDPGTTKLKPHRKLGFENGNIVRFRPAGHDGRAFRAVHVAQFGFFDEAAKPKNPAVFSEFYRALKPGCEARLYSVPDGDRGSPFYNACQRAIPYQESPPAGPPSFSSPPGSGAGASPTPAPEPPLSRRSFVRFQWPKTLMPSPYWDADRQHEAIERYGGRDSSGYVRNVLGQWGDPEDSVFPWAQFAPCIRYVAEYVCAKLLLDSATATVYVEAHQLTPGYQVRHGSDLLEEDADSGPSPLSELYRGEFAVGNFDLASVIRRVFTPSGRKEHLVGGADVGQSNDPTEIGLSEMRGTAQRWIARLQLKHFTWDQQAEAFRILDELLHPDHGWGLDAGGIGKAVEDLLRSGSGGFQFDDRLTGFVFNSRTAARNPDTGDEAEDPATERVRRVSYKELSTQLLERAMQRGELQVPWDPDVIRDFPSHTSKKLPSGDRTFSPHNDHLIDEKRVEALRVFELEHGSLHSAPIHFLTPAGSRRDSEGMAAFA